MYEMGFELGQCEERGMAGVCSECGRSVLGDDDGGRVLIGRGRRWGLRAWVLIVLVLAVVSSPWVQVWLGNEFAIWNDGAFIPGEIQYFGFTDPPMRWIDLQKAAAGDAEAVGLLQRGFAAYDDVSWGMGPREEDDCSFQIVRPRYWVDATEADWGEQDGERLRYSLVSQDIVRFGWPIDWATETTVHRYAYGGSRFAETGRFMRVNGDMIRSENTTRRVHWMNLAALAVVVMGVGYMVWRVCLWRGVVRRRARRLGVGTAVVLCALIVVVGMRHRDVLTPGRIMGNFEAVLPEPQRRWSRPELGEILSSAEKTETLAGTLMRDFGEVTEPGALVGLGIVHHAGPDQIDFNWGFGRFRLFDIGWSRFVRLEEDGSYTAVRVPKSAYDRPFYLRNGIVFLSWKSGESAMVAYGALIMIQNIVLLLVALYVVWRACATAGVWRMRRISRKRNARGVCVWCCYPCDAGA